MSEEIYVTHEAPGLSRAEEEAHLAKVISIAKDNEKKAKDGIRKYQDEMSDILEVYDADDKEALALWHNSRSMLTEAKRNVLRAQRALKKPFFGRIDFKDPSQKREEAYYIGKVGIARTPSEPEVIDWRAPIASVYYENNLGPCRYTVHNEASYTIDLHKKRTYEIDGEKLVDFFDSDVVATDDLLTKYLSKSKKNVLGEIIATIQREQNLIIRNSPRNNIIVQGCAGSGKTTVAMHRISHILYNYEEEFRPEDFYIIGSNKILLNYITSVLPDLDVYGARQMTMEELFTRLLYEDWDKAKYSIRSLEKNNPTAHKKGTKDWFMDLSDFCDAYERKEIPAEDIILEETGTLLIGPNVINTYLKENPKASMQAKKLMLNEILVSKLENVMQGKGFTFNAKKREALLKKYSEYFGKDDWKGSIFDFYQSFLASQERAGKHVDTKENSFDLYDLAALAYIYKRIKETDPIREASHVVIDEAQDFGMMAYYCLSYCMRGCTYTIMGDVSQNIHYGFGLNDWEELKKLILTGTYDAFGLLKKSYRNTIEISNFATDVLKHGDFAIYPVEPIVRHGAFVEIEEAFSEEELLQHTVLAAKDFQAKGYETIAIVTRTLEQAEELTKKLSQYLEIADTNLEEAEFNNGIMVLPVALTKGLEFDAVILYDVSKENYPLTDSEVKLLYVACTRALHELRVLHKGDLSDLIATKAPLDKHMELLVDTNDKKPIEIQIKEQTMEEVHKALVEEGDRDMAERHYIGPKRIVIKNTKEELDDTYVAPKKTVSTETTEKVASDKPFLAIPEDSSMRVPGHSKPANAVRWVKTHKEYVEIASNQGVLRLQPLNDKLLLVRFRKGQIGEFQKLPELFSPETVLKDKKLSAYGISEETPLKWAVKDQRDCVELKTSHFSVKCTKQSGALNFVKDGNTFLSEKQTEPRYIHSDASYAFFDWGKNEKLDARGVLATDLNRVTMKARYISFGGQSLRMPWLLSEKGYQIGIASKSEVLFNGIPSYGPFIKIADRTEFDYYLAVK